MRRTERPTASKARTTPLADGERPSEPDREKYRPRSLVGFAAREILPPNFSSWALGFMQSGSRGAERGDLRRYGFQLADGDLNRPSFCVINSAQMEPYSSARSSIGPVIARCVSGS